MPGSSRPQSPVRLSGTKIQTFREVVWGFYKEHGRHELPWRKTRDAYRILVSEVMLQQTQVERVVPFYADFLRKFPTASALAKAPLGDVLRAWQGLGYNRRAKMLHEAAKAVVREWKGKMPDAIEGLESLPGVGPYTARAVAAFAYGTGSAFVETNIRTVVLKHFYAGKEGVGDAEIMMVVEAALPKSKSKRGPDGTSKTKVGRNRGAREWYAALMDYGSALKRSGVKLNAKSKHYAKQSAFDGSRRQARGAILRALLAGPRKPSEIANILGRDRSQQVLAVVPGMVKEGMIELKSGKLRLPR